jgi:hypothetical protein
MGNNRDIFNLVCLWFYSEVKTCLLCDLARNLSIPEIALGVHGQHFTR